jgi:hypothetical protein
MDHVNCNAWLFSSHQENGEIKEELKKEAETTRYLNTIVKLQQTNAVSFIWTFIVIPTTSIYKW